MERYGRHELLQPDSVSRLEKIFEGSSDLVYPEYTLPVVTHPVISRQILTESPELMTAVQDGLRVIVTPSTFGRLSDTRKQEVKIMHAATEGGRVLEAEDEVIIDSKPHVLVFKGVGATGFIRNPDSPISTKHNNSRLRTSSYRTLLNNYPFCSATGSLDLYHASSEYDTSYAFQALPQYKAEKVLGVFEIDQIPDANGVLFSIEDKQNMYFTIQKLLTYNPSILARAVISNVRLYDFILVNNLQRPVTSMSLLFHMMDKYCIDNNLESVTAQQYQEGITDRVVRQESSLALLGCEMNQGGWRTLLRNISCVGEEVDLESVSLFFGFDIKTYFINIQETFRDLLIGMGAFSKYIDLLTQQDPNRNFIDIYNTIISESINSTDFTRIIQRLPHKTRDYSPSQAKNDVYMIANRIYSQAREYGISTS